MLKRLLHKIRGSEICALKPSLEALEAEATTANLERYAEFRRYTFKTKENIDLQCTINELQSANGQLQERLIDLRASSIIMEKELATYKDDLTETTTEPIEEN